MHEDVVKVNQSTHKTSSYQHREKQKDKKDGRQDEVIKYAKKIFLLKAYIAQGSIFLLWYINELQPRNPQKHHN